ncbi:MAG: NlpC/P60 family protein [Nocardioidaceae bacterium]
MSTAVRVPVTTVWTSPDARRGRDLPIAATTPDPVGWNENLLPDPPSALHGRTATQALLGEPVEVVGERAGWLEVILPWQPSSADPRGYPGWVPEAHIGDAVESDAPRVVVASPTARVGPLELSYGTVLPVAERDADRIRVRLPDGRAVAAPPTLVTLPETSETPDIDSLLGSAAQFIGLRYLWGGTSGWGFDCSGLVHLVHRRFGRTVPRDAFDQVDAVTPTDPSAAAFGDLYFFGSAGRVTHVGFTTNEPGTTQRILHAPDGDAAELVEETPLSDARRAKLVAAGTFLPRPDR